MMLAIRSSLVDALIVGIAKKKKDEPRRRKRNNPAFVVRIFFSYIVSGAGILPDRVLAV